MQDLKIEPGSELNKAVAKAIGWRFTAKEVTRNRFDEVCGTNLEGWWDGDKYVAYETPLFSTDLNAAFAAAERVGMFDGAYALEHDAPSQWSVSDPRTFGDPFLAQGPTPALAICAAILKLKEKTK